MARTLRPPFMKVDGEQVRFVQSFVHPDARFTRPALNLVWKSEKYYQLDSTHRVFLEGVYHDVVVINVCGESSGDGPVWFTVRAVVEDR